MIEPLFFRSTGEDGKDFVKNYSFRTEFLSLAVRTVEGRPFPLPEFLPPEFPRADFAGPALIDLPVFS